ncbi:hypothetical protein ACVWYJ_006882 [Bradyrhizobium sp. USDA 4471]
MPGTANRIWMVVVAQPAAEIALRAEQQHEDEAGDDGAHRERQVDQRDQEGLAREFELGDRPGGDQTEDEIEADRDRRHHERQLDRRQRLGLGERGEIGEDALREGLREHQDQRQYDEDGEE